MATSGGLVLGLRDAALYEATYGVPPATNGDTDGDGDLDFDDIPGFVALLGGNLQFLGDMDFDGDTDFDDIVGFVLGLQDQAGYEAQYGVPPSTNGDTDDDGDLDYDDITGFVELLIPSPVKGGTGTSVTVPQAVPEIPPPRVVLSRRVDRAERLHDAEIRSTNRLIGARESDTVWSENLGWLIQRHGWMARSDHT
jgi:hypothetical protein